MRRRDRKVVVVAPQILRSEVDGLGVVYTIQQHMPKLARLREREGGRPVDAKSHLRPGVLLGPLLNRASSSGIGLG